MTKQELISAITANLIIVDHTTDIEQIHFQLIEHAEEFCYSFHFTQEMISRYCYHGFLPMSICIENIPLLCLKLHQERVLLPPNHVTIKPSILRKFSAYHLCVDQAFQDCIEAIKVQHPNSWLSKSLVTLFTKLTLQSSKKKVQLHSIELWNGSILVAGEIGYTVGSSYTSLSGFHTVNSSGTMQLYALGKLLHQEGFKLWDMGMYAPYKETVGGKTYSRESFLRILSSVRDDKTRLSPKRIEVKDL